jgi:predicted RecA/RadA family phage recombinase
MALNEVYKDGFSLSYAVDSDVESGDFVVIGALVGVAEIDAKEGDDGDHYATLRHIGVFRGTTADAIDAGDPVYLASAATFGTALTGTEGSNKLVGYAIADKGAGAGDVFVRINN